MNDKREVKKIKKVAALKYSPDENQAPKVVAVGAGEVADKILQKARESDVPVYHDPQLAHTLSQLNIGDEIPPELYEVVAEILVFISNLDRAYGEKYDNI